MILSKGPDLVVVISGDKACVRACDVYASGRQWGEPATTASASWRFLSYRIRALPAITDDVSRAIARTSSESKSAGQWHF